MDLDVVFLGTAGSMPTARRAPSATLIRRGGEKLLFDCGEGTQRQLLRSDVGLVELEEIFLTHFHADHFLGLPGMLKSFALRGRDVPLSLYGPRGLDELLRSLARVIGRLSYEVAAVELAEGAVLPRDGYELRTFAVRHGREAIGYALVEEDRPGRFDVATADALGVPFGPERGSLQAGEPVTLPDGTIVTPDQVLGEARPGRKVVLTGDTAPVRRHRRGRPRRGPARARSDVLRRGGGAGAGDGALDRARGGRVARDAGVSLLALTHLSSRYGAGEVEREARTVFPATVVPRDFDLIEIPFEERGGPELVKSGARVPRAEVPSSA